MRSFKPPGIYSDSEYQVSITERVATAWDQLLLNRIIDCMTSLASPDEIGSISSAAQVRLTSFFALPPTHPTRYFSRTVLNRADGFKKIALRHRFCAMAELEMALRVINGLVGTIAAREQV